MSAPDNQAGRVRRLFATIIDFLLVALVAFIALWPLGIFEHHEAYAPVQLVLRLFTLLAGSYLLVNGWLLYKRGQTVGKRLLGIVIVNNTDSNALPFWALVVRAFSILALTILAAFLLPVAGLLVIVDVLFIFAPSRRCLHDRLVGSRVAAVDKPNND